MIKKYIAYSMVAVAIGALVVITAPAHAQDNEDGGRGAGWGMMAKGMMRPGIMGTVTAVSGNTVTINGKTKDGTATTYTVDATNAKIEKSGTAGTITSISTGDTVIVLGTVSGTSITATAIFDGMPPQGMGMMGGRGIVGTVTAVSGNTVTITSKQKNNTTTYTVDATNAKVMKQNATSTVSAIAVGDTVLVQGAVNGSAITATAIRDGLAMGKGEKAGMMFPQGNGQPVIVGTVSTISGSTLTVTSKTNTYTVDTTSAKFAVGASSAGTISDIKVGDLVIVQGTVNNTSITASLVIDHQNTAGNSEGNAAPRGILSRIGGFFSHLFGGK